MHHNYSFTLTIDACICTWYCICFGFQFASKLFFCWVGFLNKKSNQCETKNKKRAIKIWINLSCSITVPRLFRIVTFDFSFNLLNWLKHVSGFLTSPPHFAHHFQDKLLRMEDIKHKTFTGNAIKLREHPILNFELDFTSYKGTSVSWSASISDKNLKFFKNFETGYWGIEINVETSKNQSKM